jgi:DNA-directed RNA polymerase specialized sigma24 family protein
METTRLGDDWLAERCEQRRDDLTGVAYRLLGSRTEADDAVQEDCLRLSRAQPGEIENFAETASSSPPASSPSATDASLQ